MENPLSIFSQRPWKYMKTKKDRTQKHLQNLKVAQFIEKATRLTTLRVSTLQGDLYELKGGTMPLASVLLKGGPSLTLMLQTAVEHSLMEFQRLGPDGRFTEAMLKAVSMCGLEYDSKGLPHDGLEESKGGEVPGGSADDPQQAVSYWQVSDLDHIFHD
jgi:hypothetical protein